MECRQYRNGFFVYEDKNQPIVIYRKKGHQIEYDLTNQTWVTIKLYWITDCKYYFTYHKTTKDYLVERIGKSMIVNITSVDDAGYEYSANYNHGEKHYTGKIILSNKSLSLNLKRTIKKKLKQSKKE